jgi:UDP-N-acetylmuramoyl-L-alanyl-D-glutamate--2,6-diaminopimelate ligase
VGVTGTNGKSTTTTWLARLLRELGGSVISATTLGYRFDDESIAHPATFDGFIGAMHEGHHRGARFAALEMTSEALAAGFGRAWPCQIGVFTNLSHDHIDAHGTPEHYLASKAQLFVSLPKNGPLGQPSAVLNASDPSCELLAEVVPKHAQVLTYAEAGRGAAWTEPSLTVWVDRVSREGTHVVFSGTLPGLAASPSILLPAYGAVFAENAAAAMLGAYAAGVPIERSLQLLASTPAPTGRFEQVRSRPLVVVDYAHTPDALLRTVKAAKAIAGSGKVWLVFGAGGNRDREKRKPMGIAAQGADRIVLTSDNPRSESPLTIASMIREGLTGHPHVTLELDRKSAITQAVTQAGPDDVVIIAGKGHERTQVEGAEERAFSDAEIVRSLHQGLVARSEGAHGGN